MLPKPARLVDNKEFRSVYAKGRSSASDLVVLYVLPRRDGRMRFGFTVGKKVGGAVVRNRVKRLLRETVRQMLPEMTGSFDAVVVARARAAGVGLDEISSSLQRLLVRAGILPGSKQ